MQVLCQIFVRSSYELFGKKNRIVGGQRVGVNLETAILGARTDHSDRHPNLQRGPGETAPREIIRTRQFTGPGPRFSERRIVDVDKDIGVGIHPVDVGYSSVQGDGLRAVEFGRNRMVRKKRCRDSSDQNDSKLQYFGVHGAVE